MRGNAVGADDSVRIGRGCIQKRAVVYSSVLTGGGRLSANPNSGLSPPLLTAGDGGVSKDPGRGLLLIVNRRVRERTLEC